MSQLAIVANCRTAWPSRAEIDDLGITGIRTIVYSDDELARVLDDTPDHVRIVAMLNNEHEKVGGNWEGWRPAITAFARRFESKVHAVECGNELDLWGLPPEKGAHLVREAFLPLANHGIATVMGGVAGPNWPSWLEKACDLSQGSYDAVALHPYGKRPTGFKDEHWGFGYLDEAVFTACAVSGGTPVYLTEWGVKVGDAGGTEGQAEYLTKGVETLRKIGPRGIPFAAYFCWADMIGAPSERDSYNAFGLRDMQMRQRPAWYAYQAAMNTDVLPEPQEPAPMPEPTPLKMEDAYRIRWQAIHRELEYRHDFGIPTAWRRNPSWGSPLSDEITLEDGRIVQPFANALIEWVDGTAREVSE